MAGIEEFDFFGPLDDIRIVVKWLKTREGKKSARRFAFASGMCLSFFLTVMAVIPNLPMTKGKSDDGQLTALGTSLVITMMLAQVAGTVAIFWCVALKARLIRQDQRLAAQHTAYYRARLEEEFARKDMLFLAEKARWEREQDEWRAKMQNEIYELVLGQVERGVLGPRPQSKDGGTYDFPDRT